MTYELDLTTPARAEALRTAFDKVCAKNWKNPINKKVWLTKDELADVLEGVIFVAGCSANAWPIDDTTKDGRLRYHVTASGYYNAVGA